MIQLRALLKALTGERVGWFGAGLGAATLGVVGYQFVVAGLGIAAGPLPGQQPLPPLVDRASATPTRTPAPTPTPRPTPTPFPTNTPRPTATPTSAAGIPEVIATLTAGAPDAMVGVVATFVTRTRDALATVVLTPAAR